MHIVMTPGDNLTVEVEGEAIILNYDIGGRLTIRTDMPDDYNRCGTLYESGGDEVLDTDEVDVDAPTNWAPGDYQQGVSRADRRVVTWDKEFTLDLSNPVVLAFVVFAGMAMAAIAAHWLGLR